MIWHWQMLNDCYESNAIKVNQPRTAMIFIFFFKSDALAIYLSKRFSQEVAISFMEILKKSAKNVQLISEIFPQTMKLLMEGNTYEVPRLGGVWHNAIADDLYNLSINLRDSNLLRRWLSILVLKTTACFKMLLQ